MKAIINSGASLGGNRRTLKFMNEYKGFLYPPSDSTHQTHQKQIINIIEQALDEIKDNIDKIVAIGETGLDYHELNNNENKERQIKVFENVIQELANEYSTISYTCTRC